VLLYGLEAVFWPSEMKRAMVKGALWDTLLLLSTIALKRQAKIQGFSLDIDRKCLAHLELEGRLFEATGPMP
jgi:hypothetical protein